MTQIVKIIFWREAGRVEGRQVWLSFRIRGNIPLECLWKNLLVLVVTETCMLYYFHFLSPSTSLELLLGRSPTLFKRLSFGFCLRANAIVIISLGGQTAWCCPLTTSLLFITVGFWSFNNRLMWGSNENFHLFKKNKSVLLCGLFTFLVPHLVCIFWTFLIVWAGWCKPQFSTAVLDLFLLFFFCYGILGGKRDKCMCSIATLNVKLSTDLNIWLYLYSK